MFIINIILCLFVWDSKAVGVDRIKTSILQEFPNKATVFCLVTCLLESNRGAVHFRQASWLSVSGKNLSALLRGTATTHLNSAYEQLASGFLVVTWI